MEALHVYLQTLTAKKEPANLYIPVEYVLSQKGKRLRPQLVYLSTALFEGEESLALYPAAAFELLHNFTLIHDDIMDAAPIRRGKPTVYKKWNTNIAILSGDALATLALQTILKTPSDDPALVLNLAMLLSQTSIEICEGQQYDLDFETYDTIQIADYLTMIRLKTAVMLAGCLKSGAMLSKTSLENQEIIYQVGIQMGLAFQLKDDLLDAYGDNSLLGKINGGDIKENKKTYLFLRALSDATSEQREALIHYFTTPQVDFEHKFKEVKKIYNHLDIKEKTEKLIGDYAEQAISNLNSLMGINPSKTAVLKELIIQLTHREK